MSNYKSWAFLSVVNFFMCAPIVAPVNGYFQENIALNKNVTQAGNLEYPNVGDVWSAGNAVDGNKECTLVDKDHYSGTSNELVPWWQVDLGNIYSLSTIIVYGQTSENPVQLKGFQVYLLTSEHGRDKHHIYNNTNYGSGTFTIPVQQNVFGRYVRIEIPGTYRVFNTGPLLLCEVEVYPTDMQKYALVLFDEDGCTAVVETKKLHGESPLCQSVQCMLGMAVGNMYKVEILQMSDNNILDRLRYEVKTSMSTVAGNWTSDRAVDGNTGPDPNKCQCCSGTTNAPLSWWMVDLGERFPLNGIAIYSRNNENDIRQLQGFQVILSAQTTYNAASFMSESLGMFSKMYVIKLKNILARYIKIQRPGVLTLCEVKLFQGVCRVGTFGRECASGCHCVDNKPCNQLSGYCQSRACKTGWQGPSCNETCPPETFGDNCSDNCYCAEGTYTNNYGICPGKCRQGYHGAHCNKVGSDVKGESEIKGNTALIIGSAGASGALLVIAIIVGVVILKFRKRKRDSVKNEYETPNRRASPTEIRHN